MSLPKTKADAEQKFLQALNAQRVLGVEGERVLAVLLDNWSRGRMKRIVENSGAIITVTQYVDMVVDKFRAHSKYLDNLMLHKNEEEWKALITELNKWAVRYLLKNGFYTNQDTYVLANDYATEAAIQLQKSPYPYDVPLIPWMRTVLINTCRKHMRNWKQHHKILDESMDLDKVIGISNPETYNLEQGIFNQIELLAALEQLSDTRKEVILFKYVKGLAFSEIADQMGKTVGAVHNLHFQALNQLRSLMNDGEDHYD